MKKLKVSKKVILVRVLAAILCALMLLGTVAAVIPMLGDHSDHDHAYVETY
jgi:hypothetical protein